MTSTTRSPQATPGPTARGVWQLAWPSMTLFGLQSLVGLVDFVFVGALGEDAVAGVGVASQIWFSTFAILAMVTTGAVALVARETGAGNVREADRVLRMSLVLGLLVGAVVMLAMPVTESLVALFGVSREVAAIGGSYLRIVLAFNVPFAAAVVVSSGLRGAGDVRTPLWIGVIANVLNVFGDWVLIFGHLGAPALGTDGSALASGLSLTVSAGIYLLLWARNDLIVPRGPWLDGLSPHRGWRILRIGIPTAAEQGAWQLGLFLFLRIVADFGTEAVAAYLIGVRILAFSFVPGLGFAMAASTLVGQNLGADRPDLAASSGWRANAGAMLVMGGVGLTIILFAEPLAGMFGATGAITVDLAVIFIYILGAAQPLMAVEFAIGGALRGAGDTRFPLVAILAGLFLFRLGGALVITHWPGWDVTVVEVWACLLSDYAVKAALLSARFARGRWKSARV